jgi:hypothetical protein
MGEHEGTILSPACMICILNRFSSCCSVISVITTHYYSLPIPYRRNKKEIVSFGQGQLDNRNLVGKAHTGIYGNEMADQLAKAATRNSDILVSFNKIPTSTLYSELKEVVI